MKKFFYIIWSFIDAVLDHAIEENKNRLNLAPVLIAAIIGGAVTIGTKIASDIKAKKAAKKADAEAAVERSKADKEAEEVKLVAKGLVKEGDPTLAQKQRDIKEAGANAIGKVTASSGSTQEIINAAQGVQTATNKANLTAQTQAGQFKFNAKKLLSDRFVSAGQLKLQGNAAIDSRLQAAVSAIGANAQSNVDTAQALSSQGIQAASFINSDGGQKFNINELS